MLPTIRFRCSGCSARIKAPAQLLGQTRCCPGCGQRLAIKVKTPEDCGPMLSNEDIRGWSRRF
jgi:hypothetical protein